MKNVGDLARRFLSQDRYEHPVEGSRQQDPNAGLDLEAGATRAAAGTIPAPTGAEGIPSVATRGVGSKARAMPRRLRRAHLHLAPQAFDRLVQEALDALPPWVQDRLAAVAVAVEAEPPADEDRTLLGLYTGPTLYEEISCAVPPMIHIFQGPHERLCRTRGELRREVTETVLHEIAHHFGLEEGDLDRLGPLRLPERQG